MEDERSWTVACLRGRLLAERVASKAAKEEAEKLAKRLEELERKLDEEIKCRNRAEKRRKCAIKKLESLKVSDGRDQADIPSSSVSSSSPRCFLGHQRLDRDMCSSVTADLGHHGEDVKIVPCSPGDDALGRWPEESDHQLVYLKETWISLGTAKSRHKGCNPKEWATGALSDDKQETPADDDAETEDNVLALVAVSRQLDLEAGRLEINDNVHGVLLALRNVKEQLLQSLVRRAGTFH
ncbi:hypothetical protein OPV22_004674 [Ensete ventricosum]|uniref:GTD-binding domain-containing protein n=1 Tax=Ensete ventricosum TaxID=4639 RepID=A0AAV8RPF4_ENSVE|nr:hypothetical protein OPV22_004674 [Ensete ventricosum]